MNQRKTGTTDAFESGYKVLLPKQAWLLRRGDEWTIEQVASTDLKLVKMGFRISHRYSAALVFEKLEGRWEGFLP